MSPKLAKGILYLMPAVIIAASLYCAYSFGSKHEAMRAKIAYDAKEKERSDALEVLKADFAKKEEEHRSKNQEINDALKDAKQNYDLRVAALGNDYARRLRESETRAGIYSRQAQGGTAEQERLASHAARLDASLVEGKAVAAELRHTVELRDEQLKMLAKQILNDRALIE